MYLWHNLIQIPGSNETIEYLMKHRLINPPLAYEEQTFQRPAILFIKPIYNIYKTPEKLKFKR